MREETVWTFSTNRFDVELRVSPCEIAPADSFEFPEDIEAVENGSVEWFDARVVVLLDGREVGSDLLGCCAYETVREFYTSHRDRNPLNRNSSIMRSAKGANVAICHYFPSMIAEAIADARRNVRALCSVNLRAA